MKKVLTILVLAMIIPACLFAGNVIGLTVGATAAYQKASVGEVNKEVLEDIQLEDFKFGADVDVKIFVVDVNAKGFIAKNTDKETVINGILSANLAFDLSIVRIKAGLGYQYSYNTQTQAINFGRHANSFEDFENACFDLYTGVDVTLGPIVLGAYATLPTSVSVGESNWADIFTTIEDNWKDAQLGLSVGFAIL